MCFFHYVLCKCFLKRAIWKIDIVLLNMSSTINKEIIIIIIITIIIIFIII